MNVSDFERDPKRVMAALTELEDGSVVAKKQVKIYIPTRYRDKQLAVIGNDILILGLFMYTVDDRYYAVNSVNAMLRIEPTGMNTVVMDGRDYFEFVFEPGDRVIATTNVLVNSTLLYFIFEEIVARGNVPAFMSYLDLCKLYDTAQKHARVKLSSTPTILHMLLSMVARDDKDLSTYFRQTTTGDDLDRVVYIPLRSTTHGATNTTARLMGAHFSDNLVNALVDPSAREENIENILRQ